MISPRPAARGMRHARMRYARLLTVLLLVVAVRPAAAAETIFPGAVARPNNKGDQAIFYYDVRDGFTTFLNLRNEGSSELKVAMQFYGPDFGAPFTQTLTLPAVKGQSGAA